MYSYQLVAFKMFYTFVNGLLVYITVEIYLVTYYFSSSFDAVIGSGDSLLSAASGVCAVIITPASGPGP